MAGPLVGLYEGWALWAQPEPRPAWGKPRAGAVSECVFFFRPARPTGLRPVGLALGRSSTCRREALKRKYPQLLGLDGLEWPSKPYYLRLTKPRA